jgi:signal peptidase II
MSAAISWRWLWPAAAVLVADQLSKFAIDHALAGGEVREMIPGLFNLVRTDNRGVAFGILANAQSGWLTLLLIVFSLLVMLMLAWLLAGGHIRSELGQAGIALILGGAAGNVVDRVLRHSVVDFLDFHLGGYHWPAFNLADSAIVVGAAMVILSLLAERRRAAEGKA